MVIDTSALVALLGREPEAERLAQAIQGDPVRLISAVTHFEAALVMESRHGPKGGAELDRLVDRADFEIVPVTAEQSAMARQAWRRYGKGRHRAGLNFGDCFSYALARHAGEPLLFKADDFSRTDIEALDY